jgi:enoyl-CoA hydratase/carnithine racemase
MAIASNPETLTVESRDGVLELSLNRPEQLNAINAKCRDEIVALMNDFRERPEWRCLIVTGTGRAFSAGADLKDGLALGGGFELALACDFRLAAEGATFAMPEITFGSIPAGGATQRIAQLAGPSAALELVLFGERIDAATALRLNLVNRVLPADQLMAEARRWAAKLAAKAPLAVKYGREAVIKGLEMPIADGIRLEAYLGGLLRATQDRLEGRAAMLEKRPPVYQGR